MLVRELISCLAKMPKDNIVVADVLGDGEAAAIVDVCIHGGTERGFSSIVIDRSEELQSRLERISLMREE